MIQKSSLALHKIMVSNWAFMKYLNVVDYYSEYIHFIISTQLLHYSNVKVVQQSQKYLSTTYLI